jgi:hypothetical protein
MGGPKLTEKCGTRGLTAEQRSILEALELGEPPRYYQFEPLDD